MGAYYTNAMRQRTVSVYAPAKLNLHLEVGARRADGFHPISSIFQKISLADVLSVSVIDAGFELVSPLMVLPKKNTLSTAFDVFCKKTGVCGGVRVLLLKHIPSGAGLGGGSSDAGALLQALNYLFDTGLSSDELLELGAQVGSDVPFFLGSAAASFVSGRGECLRELSARSDVVGVLYCPEQASSTRDAYADFDAHNGAVDRPFRSFDDVAQMYGRSPAEWDFCNDFEATVMARIPEIARVKADFYKRGADFALMSGSGSAVFALFSSRHALKSAGLFDKKGCFPFFLLA